MWALLPVKLKPICFFIFIFYCPFFPGLLWALCSPTKHLQGWSAWFCKRISLSRVCSQGWLCLGSFFFFLTAPWGMQDHSSPIRDWTCAPLYWKYGILTTGLPGKSQDGSAFEPLEKMWGISSSCLLVILSSGGGFWLLQDGDIIWCGHVFKCKIRVLEDRYCGRRAVPEGSLALTGEK